MNEEKQASKQKNRAQIIVLLTDSRRRVAGLFFASLSCRSSRGVAAPPGLLSALGIADPTRSSPFSETLLNTSRPSTSGLGKLMMCLPDVALPFFLSFFVFTPLGCLGGAGETGLQRAMRISMFLDRESRPSFGLRAGRGARPAKRLPSAFC